MADAGMAAFQQMARGLIGRLVVVDVDTGNVQLADGVVNQHQMTAFACDHLREIPRLLQTCGRHDDAVNLIGTQSVQEIVRNVAVADDVEQQNLVGFLRSVDGAADQLREKGVVGCVFVNKQERVGLLLCQSLRLFVGLVAVLVNDPLDIGSRLLGNAFFVVDHPGDRRR